MRNHVTQHQEQEVTTKQEHSVIQIYPIYFLKAIALFSGGTRTIKVLWKIKCLNKSLIKLQV